MKYKSLFSILVTLAMISTICISCKKEIQSNDSLTIQRKVLYPIENFNYDVENFACSDEFDLYMVFLDSLSSHVSEFDTLSYNSINNWLNDNIEQETTILNSIEQRFPNFILLSITDRYLIMNEAIDYICYGYRKDLKKLELFIRMQIALASSGFISQDQLIADTNAVIDAFNTQYPNHTPYPKL